MPQQPPPKLVLPRPGSSSPAHHHPIPAPPESLFTDSFGALLPPAKYIHHPRGRIAYYVFPPSGPASGAAPTATAPARALLVHGVQTPALGLLPLITALRSRFPDTTFAAPDLWGHGLSDTPVAPHTADLFAEALDAVVGALGWAGAGAGADADAVPDAGVALVGYSFGAVVTMRYLAGAGRAAPAHSLRVHSLTLVAPAGLLRRSWFTAAQQDLLATACPAADEDAAARWVLGVLEGGDLVVPPDWEQRVARGEVVAEALRAWQMQHHPGHAASVVGVFRDGGVVDNDAAFVAARETGVRALVVLGEKDELSTEGEVLGFGGFEVRVVAGAGHGVVRENADEVAEHVGRFWGQ